SGQRIGAVNEGGTAVGFKPPSLFWDGGFFVVPVRTRAKGENMDEAVATMTRNMAVGITPTMDEVRDIARRSGTAQRTIPVYREVLADMETPVSVYLKLTNGTRTPGFLLESIEGGTRIARYSFIGANVAGTVSLDDGVPHVQGDLPEAPAEYSDPLEAIERVIQPFRTEENPKLPRFTGGAVGYLSYDAIRAFEPRVPKAKGTGLGFPDARFHIADTLVFFDHLERVLKVVSHVRLDSGRTVEEEYDRAVARIDDVSNVLHGPVPDYPLSGQSASGTVADRSTPNMTAEAYREMIERGKAYITQGDVFQVVLSQRVDVQTPAHPFSIYRSLRTVNPSPYMFYLDFGDHQIVGASPELLVRLEGDTVSNHPIAGTRPRGADDAHDALLAQDLISDEKERAEHIMLVD